jgi:hypothetical protein
MARQLDGAPDVVARRLLADALELALEPLELAGQLRPTEERHVPQPAQPVTEAQLVLRRGH